MRSLRLLYKDLEKVTGRNSKFGKNESTLIDCSNIFGGGVGNFIINNASGQALNFLEKLKECFLKNIKNFEKRIDSLNSKLPPTTTSNFGFIGAILSLSKTSDCNDSYISTKKELIEKIKNIDIKISKLEGKSPTIDNDIYENVKGIKYFELQSKIPSLFPDDKCLKNTQLLQTRTVTILKMLDKRLTKLEI